MGNTLAYHKKVKVIAVKSFILQAQGIHIVKLFISVIDALVKIS
jgi:hypothetical protein